MNNGNPHRGGSPVGYLNEFSDLEASTVIYYSNSYDLEKRLQSEDRAHRIGQTGSVTYVDLVAEKTIDERIIKSLRSKINIANEIMGEDIKDWI